MAQLITRPDRPKVAVIGLGVAGLAAVKNLIEQGFDVLGLEKNEYVGGLWNHTQDKSQVSVLTTTRSNISHQANAYTDFPYPPGTPDYPTGEQVASYLNGYADHFDLRRHFRLGVRTRKIRRASSDDGWEVDISTVGPSLTDKKIETLSFDRVYVSTGYLGVPLNPRLPGLEGFKGQTLHAKEYKNPEPFKGKRVLVVGLGNTGADTATSLVGHADKIYACHRRGARIFTRYTNGRPSDHKATRRMSGIGGWLSELFPTTMAYLTDKIMEKVVMSCYNSKSANPVKVDPAWKLLPAPPFATAPATSSDTLVKYFSTGEVKPLTAVKQITEGGVITAEGEFEIDVIIFATGSKYDYSIFDDSVSPIHPNATKPCPMLYQSAISIKYPDSLAVVGPYKSFSFAAMLNDDLTSQAIAQVWKGVVPLPGPEAMEKWCDEQWTFRMKVTKGEGSTRHGLIPRRLEEWLGKAAGTGVAENLGWGAKAWKFWWKNRELYKLVMDGISTPHVHRLFEGREGGRTRWEGAEEAIWRLNGKDKA